MNDSLEEIYELEQSIEEKKICFCSKYLPSRFSVLCEHFVCGWDFYFPLLVALCLFSFATFTFNRMAIGLSNASVKIFYLVVYDLFSLLFLSSYIRTIFTDPGIVPINWPNLDLEQSCPKIPKKVMTDEEHELARLRPRPPRAKYTKRLCALIRKLDHICPWVANAVGFCNYKFFYLMLMYGFLTCLTGAFMIIPILTKPSRSKIGKEFLIPTLIIYGLFFLNIGNLLMHHTFLLLRNMTTLEYLEMSYAKEQGEDYPNIYDLGTFANVKQVLGQKIIVWFIPTGFSVKGDGYSFPTNGLDCPRNELRSVSSLSHPKTSEKTERSYGKISDDEIYNNHSQNQDDPVVQALGIPLTEDSIYIDEQTSQISTKY
ncbi:protein s-acyltransferase 16-related [Anaeramoeba ignava]|uniref:Palmitoyltransferase n=1 Tax=Anaeramoeba ignava TaxID=1746090 RepID=A0A9Q0LI89_ANAIG|nr:protein s-acyltransferase 16-related [Anaeramoeba ignava]|eukprot:Anaeramoba_ignava/a611594_69.p1 GENE.a611594_69~~a611594_69.p1  ORF type:complete len:372 (-),score=67.76 a611594_69:252-1367(-)